MSDIKISRPIETLRLQLSTHTPGDLDDSAAMWGDPAVTRFIGGKPSTREEAWARLLRYAGQWAFSGFGYWVIREKYSQKFIGEVGFADFRRDINPSFGDLPEAGWALAPWAHGKGYATEALAAILAWADASLISDKTVCLIDPNNAPSIRLAAKHGYIEHEIAIYKNNQVLIFKRTSVIQI